MQLCVPQMPGLFSGGNDEDFWSFNVWIAFLLYALIQISWAYWSSLPPHPRLQNLSSSVGPPWLSSLIPRLPTYALFVRDALLAITLAGSTLKLLIFFFILCPLIAHPRKGRAVFKYYEFTKILSFRWKQQFLLFGMLYNILSWGS